MKRYLLVCSVLTGLFISLSSNNSGPAIFGNGIRNGGPGSAGTCSSCHGGGSGSTSMTISLVEKSNSAPANGKYKPGVVYTIRIEGNNANLNSFGFQVTSAFDNNSQAGDFSNLGSDKHVATVNNIKVLEHSQSIAKSGGIFQTSADWTAPAAGGGNVSFYGVINAVNGNGNESGDLTSTPVKITLTEETGTSIEEPNEATAFAVYPNPTTDQIHFKIAGVGHSMMARIIDMSGRILSQKQLESNIGDFHTINVAKLPAGSYILQISNVDGEVKRANFVRK